MKDTNCIAHDIYIIRDLGQDATIPHLCMTQGPALKLWVCFLFSPLIGRHITFSLLESESHLSGITLFKLS